MARLGDLFPEDLQEAAGIKPAPPAAQLLSALRPPGRCGTASMHGCLRFALLGAAVSSRFNAWRPGWTDVFLKRSAGASANTIPRWLNKGPLS